MKFLSIFLILFASLANAQNVTISRPDTLVNSDTAYQDFTFSGESSIKAVQIRLKKISGILRGQVHVYRQDRKMTPAGKLGPIEWIPVISWDLVDVKEQFRVLYGPDHRPGKYRVACITNGIICSQLWLRFLTRI
jgi:hypothetical protein